MDVLDTHAQENVHVARPGGFKVGAQAGKGGLSRRPSLKPRRALGDITNEGGQGAKRAGTPGKRSGPTKEANPKAKMGMQVAADTPARAAGDELDDIEHAHLDSAEVDYLEDLGLNMKLMAPNAEVMSQLTQRPQKENRPMKFELENVADPGARQQFHLVHLRR
jgi:hypothetical protein